ncbi:unnamed protein product [Schistocephalus solidus]|uniref:NUC153 domain-containing protein n=1 Tax=Schistocephalus solidus TaxID=70667 RepID=A0A183TIK3_SCHSO|nr:unnamed protein product [Schistocephalus solidus]
MKRMKEEEEHGPTELWESSSTGSGEGSDEEEAEKKNDHSVKQSVKPQKKEHGKRKTGGLRNEDEEEEKEKEQLPGDVDADERKAWRLTSVSQRRRLRRYQMNRLKYFYAIAEFDSVETAAAIYEACDGVEYGSTGIRFDLRFVDDSETFSVSCVNPFDHSYVPPEWAHLVTECCEVNKTKFVPRAFETPAVHSTRITLTWDKTPAARTEWLREQFEASNDPKATLTQRKDELGEYLALSSSGQSTAAPSDVDEPGPAPTVPRIHKHRPPRVPADQLRTALLEAIGENNADKSDQLDDGDEVEADEEEEVFDLNAPGDASEEADEDEEYDLTEDVSVRERRPPLILKHGRRKVSRKGETEEGKKTVESDDDLDFADMENRMSDSEGSDGNRPHKKRKRGIHEDGVDPAERKKRRKSLQWAATEDGEEDDRFDDFLLNPAFGVSQMHRNYKDASEFLNFMRRRRAPKVVGSIKT